MNPGEVLLAMLARFVRRDSLGCASNVSQGQVQEEELDSCRAAGERRPVKKRDEGWGETEAGSPAPRVCGA